VAEILLGTSVSGRAGAAAREAPAQASLAALSAAGIASCVNLAFHDDAPPASPLQTLPMLRLDARVVSGVEGARKPVVTEMLDILAAEADRRGIQRIGIVNGDIVVTAAAIDAAVATPRGALAMARTDTGGGLPESLLRHGIDMFTFDAGFWQRHRRRFRAYLLGEPVWDNVYAAIVACHGGEIVNREGLLLHARHPPAFGASPYARYIQLLAARDSAYFSLWCTYVARAEALAAERALSGADAELQRQIFRAPGFAAGAAGIARATWWRARQALGA
jgi:hypothetical protein